ncbi:MAG: citrate lyase subunit beta / citryl-CoA lyase [Alphaproteobacteria bacterium]|jgi:citrate lyase subunit beta/citryl-CoA lyase|nr:citrate lyase subunit beta / citryl-CoA lyase [Alphaproteobacteria bacterium]
MPAAGVHDNAAEVMRSLLFVPADGGAKLDKAFASGADAVIVDLEDSIAPDRKAQARASAAAFVTQARAQARRPRLLVRVNGLATGLTDADLDAIVPAQPDAILLPKAEGGAAMAAADAKLAACEARFGVADGHIRILAQAIETAAGVFAAGTFRGASARLIGMTWGPEDLSAEIGAEASRDADGRLTEPFRLVRALCLFGAALAGTAAIETVHVDFRNLEGLRRDTEEARRDGFSGRLAIHPAQVAVINEVFTPTPQALARATAIAAAFAAAPGVGVVAIDGVMYDRPHLLRAQQLIARAAAAGVS